MKKLSLLFVSVSILFSCSKEVEKEKVLELDGFTMTGPGEWEIEKEEGSQLILLGHDTAIVQVGVSTDTLLEALPNVAPKAMIPIFLANGVDTSGWRFLKKDHVTLADMKPYMKHTYDTVTIDGVKAKLVKPKKVAYGMTGVYFDKVKASDGTSQRLTIVGHDMSEEDQNNLLAAIHSLRFK